MTRIPLTDEDILVTDDDFSLVTVRIDCEKKDRGYDDDHKYAEQLKKQILDDHEFREKDMTCPQYRLSVTQYKELKEKAEKYDWIVERDAQGNEHYVEKLEQENKRLKDTIKLAGSSEEKYVKEVQKNKEIVQKVRKLYNRYGILYGFDNSLMKELKEIVGE